VKSCQVRYQLVDLFAAELHRRHQRPWLKVIRILNPRMQILRRIQCRTSGNRRSALQVGQIRPKRAVAAVPAMVWQLVHASVFKNVPARRHAGILHSGLSLLLHPRVKFFRRIHVHPQQIFACSTPQNCAHCPT